MRLKSLIVLFLLLLTAFGCNPVNGSYEGDGGTHFDKIVFTSKHKVELVFLGSIVEAEYVKEGNNIKINTAMGKQVLKIDRDGCLDGGFIMGKYCKE